ncbi:MAG: hypothetical protein M3463_15905 [Verrucomicrobiota bacterium]|nr:hypothetical protein [Verrucomicrobiota bacterium]
MTTLVYAFYQQGSSDGILDIVNRSTDKGVKVTGIQQVARLMVKEGKFDEAQAWLETLPKELTFRGFEQLVEVGAEHDPERWVNYVQRFENKHERQQLVNWVLVRLIEKNPADGARIFSKLAPDQQVGGAMTLVNHWYPTDPKAVKTWAETVGNQHVKDTVFRYLVFQLAKTSRDEAIAMAQRIQNPELRESALRANLIFVSNVAAPADR